MPKARSSVTRKPKVIPYQKGFKVPNKKSQSAALGWPKGKALKPEYEPDQELFPPLPKCTSIDDWLAQYNERGQSYNVFLKQCPWLPKNPTKTGLSERFPEKAIYIMPVGKFQPGDNSPDIKLLVEYSKIFLGLPVLTLEPVTVAIANGHVYWTVKTTDGEEKIRMKCRHDKSTNHYQLCVGDALRILKRLKPVSAFCLIALTLCDLYDATADLFVAGMATGNQYVAIFSLFRYDPFKSFSKELWFEVKVKKVCDEARRRKMILQRSCRLVVHELAHLLGIDHCIYYACCMNGSGHLEEDFSQPMYLCPVDLRKLQTLVRFNVIQRYDQLLNFYKQHGFTDESDWMLRQIEHIKGKMTSSSLPSQSSAGSH